MACALDHTSPHCLVISGRTSRSNQPSPLLRVFRRLPSNRTIENGQVWHSVSILRQEHACWNSNHVQPPTYLVHLQTESNDNQWNRRLVLCNRGPNPILLELGDDQERKTRDTHGSEHMVTIPNDSAEILLIDFEANSYRFGAVSRLAHVRS